MHYGKAAVIFLKFEGTWNVFFVKIVLSHFLTLTNRLTEFILIQTVNTEMVQLCTNLTYV